MTCFASSNKNGRFVYQLFKLVELDTSVTAEEKEEPDTRKNACSIYWF